MPKLIRLACQHIGHSDWHKATEAYLIADSWADFLTHLKANYHVGCIDENDPDTIRVSNPDHMRLILARTMGLEVSDSFDASGSLVGATVSGPMRRLTEWYMGNDWDNTGCYDCTVYNWRDYRDISERDAVTLVRLNVATRIP